MTRGRSVALFTLALGFASPALLARADEIEPDRRAPFYDAQGTMMPAPNYKRPSPDAFIVAPFVRTGELFIPDRASGALEVETMLELGNPIVSGGIGYANVGSAHGFDLELGLFRWWLAVPIFAGHGWRGSWTLPDATVSLAGFPGQSAPPSWALAFTTRLGGFRFAHCLHATCLELAAEATAGPVIVEVEKVHLGIYAGGQLELGFAFWH